MLSFDTQSLKEEVRRKRKTSKTEKVRQAEFKLSLSKENYSSIMPSMMCNGILILPISIAMIVIGDQYNPLDSCSIQISQVLEVMGGLALFTAIFYIMVGLACDTTVEFPIKVVTGLAHFGVRIWASVVVFGAYSTWEHDDKSSENFCEYTPFMFAFVILIIQWVLFGINIIMGWLK